MADGGGVLSYDIEPSKTPWLWKAQRCFANAETLRKCGQLDCAANRYYYAVLQVAFHFIVGASNEKADKYKRKHGEVTNNYVRWHDRNAQEAVSRARGIRNQADYTPILCNKHRVEKAAEKVAPMLERAMERAGVKKKEQK